MKAITVIEPGHMEMLDVKMPSITEPDQVLEQSLCCISKGNRA